MAQKIRKWHDHDENLNKALHEEYVLKKFYD